jgi:hypothetical protein
MPFDTLRIARFAASIPDAGAPRRSLAPILLFTVCKEGKNMDLVYLSIVIGFFALSWGLIGYCDRLHKASVGAADERGYHA